MIERLPGASPAALTDERHWTGKHAKSVVFILSTLVAIGAYLAFTIPVSVFPSTAL